MNFGLARKIGLTALFVINTAFAAFTEQQPIEVNVGIYAPFANKQAFIGRNILAAMEMGSEQLKSARVHYSFYTLDKLSDQKQAAQVLQKFIDARHINILVTEGSDNGILAAPLAKKNGILHFSMASDPAIADGINNFLAWSPALEQARVLVDELKKRQIKRVGIIHADDSSDRILARHVEQQVASQDAIALLIKQEISSTRKDFTAMTNDLRKNPVDLYLVMAKPEQIERSQKCQ